MNPLQLSLPIDEFLARAPSPGIPRPRRIFCNRNLRMSDIAWVGFDMDYTLAIYNQPEMDELSIQATIEKLVARGYPEFVRTIPYSTELPGARPAHRQAVRPHPQDEPLQVRDEGLPRLPRARERRAARSSTTRRRSARRRRATTGSTRSTRCREAALYAALVEAHGEARAPRSTTRKTFTDIRESIDEAHRDGTILETVAADFPRFVDQGPRPRADAPQAPQRGQEALPPDELALVVHRQDDEVPARRRDERVPALAELLRRRHRRRDQARLLPGAAAADGARRREARRRRRSRSSAARSTRAATCTISSARSASSGDEVLYVGDHIYGDILRSKKESAWRTAMIIQELEGEVAAHDSCQRGLRARRAARGRARPARGRASLLPDALQGPLAAIDHAHAQAERLHPWPRPRPSAARIKRAIDRVRGRLRLVDGELHTIERRVDQRFHPFWGSLLKEENEQSSFGAQVEEYACLYTSRVSQLPVVLAAAVLPEPARRDGARNRDLSVGRRSLVTARRERRPCQASPAARRSRAFRTNRSRPRCRTFRH